jgi:signal transduction histidine kinase
MTNIQRHARATLATIDLELGEQQAHLRLCDNGQGFDPDQLKQPQHKQGTGYGLTGLEERLEIVGGSLKLESRPGGGTTLEITVPSLFNTAGTLPVVVSAV